MTTPTPADLRDRIRRAICEASGFTWLPDELMEPDEYGEHADAVLAVLPCRTAADIAAAIGPNMLFGLQDAELYGEPGAERIRDWVKWISETVAALPASAPAAPADRATVLREAADFIRDAHFTGGMSVQEIGVALRHMADEAQLTETEDGDPICGDRYDDEACELEPGHAGAHCAGIVCWDYGRAPATAATEEPQP